MSDRDVWGLAAVFLALLGWFITGWIWANPEDATYAGYGAASTSLVWSLVLSVIYRAAPNWLRST